MSSSRQAVQLDYRDGHDARSRRHAAPYRQVVSRGLWYLVAYDLTRDDWRIFRPDRISDVERLTGAMEHPDLPAENLSAWFASDYGRLRSPGH